MWASPVGSRTTSPGISRVSGRPGMRSHARPSVAAWKAAPGTASRARPQARSTGYLTTGRVTVMNLSGSVALVTGANRGLGARLVTELLRAGATKLYATTRAPAAAGDDPRVQPLRLDVTDPASVAAATAAAPDVTVLVNNAGVLAFGSALTGDLASFERDLATNYLGTLRVTRA